MEAVFHEVFLTSPAKKCSILSFIRLCGDARKLRQARRGHGSLKILPARDIGVGEGSGSQTCYFDAYQRRVSIYASQQNDGPFMLENC